MSSVGGWRDGVRGLLRAILPSPPVWGRHPDELTVRVEDPVRAGILRGIPGRDDPSVLVIRPLGFLDHNRVADAREADRDWLQPWEPTLPPTSTEYVPTLSEYRRSLERAHREGSALSMLMEVDGEVAGVVAVSQVQRGAALSASIGYWVAARHARRGLGSFAVASTIDLLIGELGLHRVEISVRPENAASLALCRKLGLREEGFKPRYLHINGAWADHVCFGIDAESMPEGGLAPSLL